MFETFLKILRGFFRVVIAYYVAWFILFGIAAVLNFAWLVSLGRLNEAAIAYISVAIVAAVITFVVWVRRDSAEASRRLEKHLRKSDRATEDDSEADDDGDGAKLPTSEHIRPAPGQDR